jgi:hypothetical protein
LTGIVFGNIYPDTVKIELIGGHMTHAYTLPAPTLMQRLWNDSPGFTGLAVLITLATLPLLIATGLDPRLYQGEGIWIKPVKFHVALAIYLATLAFFCRWVPQATRDSRLWRLFVGAVIAAISAELLWIGGAAALGTGSHFNTSSAFWGGLYTLMGVAAVILTSGALGVGIAIWRNPDTGLPGPAKLSVVLGLILTFVLTLITAGTMANTPGHFVGTPETGVTFPIFGWSREVGDLRVAHFIATHALHGIPLAGWAAARWLPPTPARVAVILAASGYTAITAAVFWQALAGLPLF